MQQPHSRSFWSGRRVLVTGHTGFKGSWLVCWLRDLGAVVHGVSLPGDHGDPCLWNDLALEGVTETRADLSTDSWVEDAVRFNPEVVVHMAAQSLVSEGYRDPATTFLTNVQGTVQVMAALPRFADLLATLVVTTDKVYDTRQPAPYGEDQFLGGSDPYSASKACAELVTHSWPGLSTPVATARAGNVIGGGDYSINRIVPDIVRAWSKGDALTLRRPTAVRPWQHVIEPLAGYLSYIERLAAGDPLPTALNFGPDREQAVPVVELVEHAAREWQRLTGAATPSWQVVPEPGMPETQDLTLEPGLAQTTLRWGNRWSWQEATTASLEWYVGAATGREPRDLMLAQLRAYHAA
ncbi:MAG: CDP-glucose 4,6-dehydratase [Nocardioides sp.]